jgi:protein-tyrosine phosphatase
VSAAQPLSTRSFSILVVCTANVCRSPVAEVELASALGSAGIGVASAGLRADPGQPMAPEIARLLQVSPDRVLSRRLTPAMAREGDLLLTMTRRQRSAVVGFAPATLRRVFTLTEFADLATLVEEAGVLPPGQDARERLSALTLAAPRFRSGRSAEDDDIVDPFDRGEAAYEQTVRRIRASVARLTATVLGGPERRPSR